MANVPMTLEEKRDLVERYEQADPLGKARIAAELGISLTWLRGKVRDLRQEVRVADELADAD